MGTFHKLSPKHLERYVNEFAGKNNVRDLYTIDQMRHLVRRVLSSIAFSSQQIGNFFPCVHSYYLAIPGLPRHDSLSGRFPPASSPSV